jgi:hypothetical protein
MMQNTKYSQWVGKDDVRTGSTYDGLVMMIIKNMKYSRWVGDDDYKEHEELTMGW